MVEEDVFVPPAAVTPGSGVGVYVQLGISVGSGVAGSSGVGVGTAVGEGDGVGVAAMIAAHFPSNAVGVVGASPPPVAVSMVTAMSRVSATAPVRITLDFFMLLCSFILFCPQNLKAAIFQVVPRSLSWFEKPLSLNKIEGVRSIGRVLHDLFVCLESAINLVVVF